MNETTKMALKVVIAIAKTLLGDWAPPSRPVGHLI